MSSYALEFSSNPHGLEINKSYAAIDKFDWKRRQMVKYQLRNRGIKDKRVLAAISKVPRHEFVDSSLRDLAYSDSPLPIGHNQTISQPYIVAYMTEAGEISPSDKVLEIGTGSGYQAAVLGEIAKEVYSIEIIPQLAIKARRTLSRLGYQNIQVKTGDGYQGWVENAPYDAIIVTAAPESIPKPLIEQLAINGKMVIPVGKSNQEIFVLTKTQNGTLSEKTIPVRFVPMRRKFLQ
ncbi:protein-L-isoaspartate(D-aspartate) O-methyltransferase [Mastigocoleus sp. MO_188.B34]|uniref:protein-L-isoaspartate(D-aspartate) O-methyltransferase n=1 Tax=Mastigocoleus sp. MO_188.B34 TaxID=3036635 RepID=UPI0026265CC8|nr:protein-L-isoaspartate(D-aspartate) O-methyltransferase [Mastigocoleus sp. MO_188.B34]